MTIIPSPLSMVGSASCMCLPSETKGSLGVFVCVCRLHLVQCGGQQCLRVETARGLSCE